MATGGAPETLSAETFTTKPGQCFRLIEAVTGHTQHCSNRVVCTGVFTDSKGKTWTVDACAEHAGELPEPKEPPGSNES